MHTDMPHDEIIQLVANQLSNNFVLDLNETNILESCFDATLKRCAYCFKHSHNKYYRKDGEVYFNPFHSGQYSIFLYYLSREIYTDNESRSLADRVYYLNKTLNGLDLFYEVEMPDIFFLDHPVGSVIGRATFSNYFSFSQGCTVGNNKGIYPIIGENVRMTSGSKILGDSRIGSNVIISANTYIKDTNIPDCSIVFGSSPNLTIKHREVDYFRRH